MNAFPPNLELSAVDSFANRATKYFTRRIAIRLDADLSVSQAPARVRLEIVQDAALPAGALHLGGIGRGCRRTFMEL